MISLRPSAALLAVPLLLVACAGTPSNRGRPQAVDTPTGMGKLAKTAWRATTKAAFRQPITTVKLGWAMLRYRTQELISSNLPALPMAEETIPEVPGSPEFERRLDAEHFPRAESGELKWLVDGAEFFPELDRQIAAARESIDIQIFIFDNDDIAVRYADRLKARSHETKVRVLFDDLGSTFAHTAAPETPAPGNFVPPVDMKDYLENGSKVRVRRILDPWLSSDHTKLLVFDRQTAILGGMNIGREYYSEWHDLMVRVDGPVVGTLSRDFNRAWRKAGPAGDFALLRSPAGFRQPQPADGGVPLRVLRTDPAEGRHEVLDAMLLAIRGARKRVWIENPYFAHDGVVSAVAAAARRGVDVRVVIPAEGDSRIMDAGNLATANHLIAAGAKVFRYPRMTHMKVMICDDWATLGSANLDTLSLRINRELNLAFSRKGEVRELERAVFLPDFRQSRRLTLKDADSVIGKLVEPIADQL